jgi:hypothetical protein
LREFEAAINDEHACAGAGEEDCRGTSIADAVTGCATSGDDCDLAAKAEFGFQTGR